MQLNEFLGNKAEEITQEDVIEWLNNNKNSHSHAKRIPITACYDTKADYLKLHEVSIKSNTTYIERFLFELPSWHSMINKNMMKKANMRDIFDVILTREDVALKKPNPEIYITSPRWD